MVNTKRARCFRIYKKINSVKKSIQDSIRKFCNEKETIY